MGAGLCADSLPLNELPPFMTGNFAIVDILKFISIDCPYPINIVLLTVRLPVQVRNINNRFTFAAILDLNKVQRIKKTGAVGETCQ